HAYAVYQEQMAARQDKSGVKTEKPKTEGQAVADNKAPAAQAAQVGVVAAPGKVIKARIGPQTPSSIGPEPARVAPQAQAPAAPKTSKAPAPEPLTIKASVPLFSVPSK